MPRNRQNLPLKLGKKSSSSSTSSKGGGGDSKKTRGRKNNAENKNNKKIVIGTRSGARFRPAKVSTDDEGLESMEGFFKAQDEQSTHTENSSASRTNEGVVVVRRGGGVLKSTARTRRKHKPKTPKRVRMSVGGDDNNDVDDNDDETVESNKKMPAPKRQRPTAAAAAAAHHEEEENTSQEDEASLNKEDADRLTQDYVKKLKSKVTSPSELSKVSTAPPTPFEEQERARFAIHKDDDDDEHVDKDAPHADDGLLTQPTEDEDEEMATHPQASKASTDDRKPAALMDRPDSPEPEFPPMGLDDDLGPPEHSDNDDDDDNDFGLEPPDHSEDDDDDEPDTREDREDPLTKQSSDEESAEAEHTEEPAPAAAATSDSGGSDSDSDKEGAGYNMVHDPETPASVRKKRAKEERVALAKRKREKERKKKKRRGSDVSDTDDDELSTIHTPLRKQSKKKKKKKRNVVFSPQGVPIANRSYERKPLDDFIVENNSDDDYGVGVRRSRRAKCKPLEFWRNERLEYGAHNETGVLGRAMGDMPVVVSVIKAGKTPHKKRKPVQRKNVDDSSKKRKKQQRVQEQEEEKPYDLTKIKKKYKVIDGEVAFLWDDLADDPGDMKVVAYAEGLQPTDLPMSNQRTEKDGNVVGKASQAFNIPNHDSENYVGYIMGNLRLPPKGVKDPESVGPCSQTFTVCDCQPKALEIAYGDPDLPEGILDPETAQRFYLSPGDLFRVPPGNCYRLQNRSKTKDALLTWTIIRPRNVANDSDSED